MYIEMSRSGSAASRCSSWATIRFATSSSIADPRNTIRGDPDEVWEALTDPELLAEWLGEDGHAIVEQAEPSERLVLWLYEDDDPGSRVELRLIAVPAGTRVTVTEAPVGPFALAAA